MLEKIWEAPVSHRASNGLLMTWMELSLGSGSLAGLSESLRVWSIALIFDPKFLRFLELQTNLRALYAGPP